MIFAFDFPHKTGKKFSRPYYNEKKVKFNGLMDLPKNRHPYFGPATPSLVDLCIKFDDPRNYKVNFDKIQKELSYQYQFSLEDGIRELYEEIQKGSYKK